MVSENPPSIPGCTETEVFEHNSAVMLIIDPDARTIVDANPAACRFYGLDRPAMRGMSIADLGMAPPADVAERRRTEDRLRESEERYRTLVEDAVLGVYRTTPDGRILTANPALCRMLGYSSQEDIQSRNLEADGFQPEYNRREFRITLEKENVISGREAVWKRSDGTSIVVRENARVVRDAIGNPLWYDGTVEDITERKLAEDRLRESEELFRMISENVSDMIALLDRDGNRVYNSPSYNALLVDAGKLRGTNSFQEIHPDDRERIRQAFRETVRTGVGQRTEYRFISPNGGVHQIESQGSTIKDNNGRVVNVLVVSRDVTEKRSIDQQLLRSQRMESIGTLASGIAHDLNNVLSPIMMSIETIRKRLPSPRDQRLLDTVETAAVRGSEIVKQVLAFGRGVKGERITLQPKHVIMEILKIAGETFPKSIELRKDVPKDLWTISADPTQMHQVVLNMCLNARDAMPDGGILTIAGENVELDESYTRMNIEAKAGPHVCISVADTGSGIPASILERIFEPFFTTKEPGKGTGLGLSTTLAIVKSHGGFINVYSEMRKGTTFRAYFPAPQGEGIAPGVEEEEADLPFGNGEMILVVDDEASIRDVTQQTLDAAGYAVTTACDGTEAIALYAQRRNSVAAVITDMVMPFMDGTSTIRAIRKLNPQAIVIATSGFAGDAQVARASDSGADCFLTKPYTAKKLLVALDAMLRKGNSPGNDKRA